MRSQITRIVFVVVIGALGYFAYTTFYHRNIIRISPPESPPKFSVSYLFYFPPSSSLPFIPSEFMGGDSVKQEIASDIRGIRDMGFDGIKLVFHFGASNDLENWVAKKAAKEGLYPIGLLAGHGKRSKDRAFTEEEMQEWEEFVREQVKENKEIVYFWEVWNEPDVEFFRYGTPEEYLELLKRTHPIIEKENPRAKVVVTLDVPAHDQEIREFSERCLSLGAGDYFDILSFHPYAPGPYIVEDVFRSSLEAEKKLQARYGHRWPLWISEIGQPASQVSEEKQAALAEMVFKEAYRNNIPVVWLHYSDERIFSLYPDNSSGWGLLRQDGTPKPAYEKVRAFLRGAK